MPSLRRFLILLANKPSPENVRSASTDVGLIVYLIFIRNFQSTFNDIQLKKCFNHLKNIIPQTKH